LTIERLQAIANRLASTRHKDRDEVAGLSAERADSIVGGAVVIEALMELARAKHVLVSGQGVREGIALSLLGGTVASTREVKEASLASLVARFDSWHAEAAARRRAIASALLRALDPAAGSAIAAALDDGARVLDTGTSLDFFERHEHVADMLLATELHGFTHEEIARVSGLVRLAGDRHADLDALSPLLSGPDRAQLVQSAAILALADEIERRCPPGRAIAVSCSVGRDVIKVSVPFLSAWSSRDLGQRFERAFGKALVVKVG
jgi:exopolyphosphatase / guanosine-5'-triphosphate,3'-diphosphate pyrophosphatase